MSDPRRFYSGWLVDPADRADLLDRLPPRYALVVAHHVTLKLGDGAPPEAVEHCEIVGEADDGSGVQAMVVRLGGTISRPDGGTYHVTWSLAPGREARESNDVIRAYGWRPLDPPVRIRLEPRLLER